MKAEYLQRGEALDYTNATEDTIPAGAIVAIATRLGVAGCDIPPGKTGSLGIGAQALQSAVERAVGADIG